MFTATKSQKAIIAKFTDKAKEAFDKMTDDAKTLHMETLEDMASSTVASVEGFVDAGIEEDRDDCPIMSVDSLPIDQTVSYEFLGTMPLFTTTEKEHWEKSICDGKNVWLNRAYRFKNQKTGKEFALYATASLWQLTKVPTTVSHPAIRPQANPVVLLNYLGLVEGKEKLEKEFNLKITKGNSAHICKLMIPNTVKYNKYDTGVINFTRSPIPNLGKLEEVALTEMEKIQRDWDNQTRTDAPAIVEGVESSVQVLS